MPNPIYSKQNLKNVRDDFSRLENDIPNWSELSDDELFDLIQDQYQSLTLESLNISEPKLNKIKSKVAKVKAKRQEQPFNGDQSLNYSLRVQLTNGKIRTVYSRVEPTQNKVPNRIYDRDGSPSQINSRSSKLISFKKLNK